ncbi:hypothetical protein Tco_0925651 [Tanacetum coccineum]|uniref:Uncharacterized protein n=1 Tax=Tanacetum coccineum TaxID=301880 RepID=A0ABQ5D8G2_9ASTR
MNISTNQSIEFLTWRQQKLLKAKGYCYYEKRSHKLEREKEVKTLGMNLFLRSGTLRRRSLGEEDASKQEGNLTRENRVIRATLKKYSTVLILTTTELIPPPKQQQQLFEDEDLTIAQTLVKMRSEKSKVRGVVMQEPSETATRPTVPPQQHMQAELEEEERQREEDANITEWDDVQAMMDSDYELAARLQEQEQGELTIEERSKMFVELMDKRKKHFARLRAEEQRRKPITKAQKRNQMCTYLKNMAGFTHNQLKNKNFKEIQKAFDKTMNWINSFVPMDSEVVKGNKDKAEGSKKRTREELDEESVKRQKLEDDAEKAELKLCLEIVSYDDKAVNFEPLATKSPIVDWKIQILGEDIYYQIKRADRSYKCTISSVKC